MIRLRYKLAGDLYIPQFYSEQNTWEDFKVKHITPSLKNLCYHLGCISLPRTYDGGQWFYEPKQSEQVRDMSLIFSKEMLVCAFLGAAKIVFDYQPKEFEV